MGNLCGKQSKDAFDGPGRTLGSAPAPATKASVPASANAASTKNYTVGGSGRTVGGSNPAPESRPPGLAAVDAAEARNKSKPGALQKRLDAQKRKTDNENLLDAAKGNAEFRIIDETAARLRHD